jgi:hypothetical protein
MQGGITFSDVNRVVEGKSFGTHQAPPVRTLLMGRFCIPERLPIRIRWLPINSGSRPIKWAKSHLDVTSVPCHKCSTEIPVLAVLLRCIAGESILRERRNLRGLDNVLLSVTFPSVDLRAPSAANKRSVSTGQIRVSTCP